VKIAIIGASGPVGKCVVQELHNRGHVITGISTHPDLVPALPDVAAVYGDANDPATVSTLIRSHDVVVTSVQFLKTDPDILIPAVRSSGVPRYVVVGGSGTLLAPGTETRIMHTATFPANFAAPAEAAARFFDRLRKEPELDWTYLSPPPGFGPGERTGTFRIGRDEMLVDQDGKSAISYADYAIALADEIERPRHKRQRFTVAY
jgi:putative NADH-flavin reductase